MTTPATPVPTTLDHARLLHLHGDAERIASVLDLFLNDVLPDFTVLNEHLTAQRWPDVVRTAHNLLPWLGMAGLTQLETDLREFERQARYEPHPDVLAQHWQAFQARLAQSLPLLRAERDRLAAGGAA